MKTSHLLQFKIHKLSTTRGVTLLEIAIVVGALALLSLVFTRPFISFRNEQVLTATAEQVFALMNEARADTLAARSGTHYGVHLESARAVYFAGSVFTEGAPGNAPLIFPANISATTTLAGGGTDIVFTRLTGETANYGSIVLILNNNASSTRTIMISEAGLVNITR